MAYDVGRVLHGEGVGTVKKQRRFNAHERAVERKLDRIIELLEMQNKTLIDWSVEE